MSNGEKQSWSRENVRGGEEERAKAENELRLTGKRVWDNGFGEGSYLDFLAVDPILMADRTLYSRLYPLKQ
jgi:hypothetical protein